MQLGRFAKAIKEETEAEEQEKMSDATFLVGKTDADGWLPVKYPEDIALWMQSLQAKAVKDERVTSSPGIVRKWCHLPGLHVDARNIPGRLPSHHG